MNYQACLSEMPIAVKEVDGVSYSFFSDGCIYRTKDGYLVAYKEIKEVEFPELLDILDVDILDG
jgi:hypothetical protein